MFWDRFFTKKKNKYEKSPVIQELLEELKMAKDEITIAEYAFNHASDENVEYAIHNLDNARMKLNIILRDIKREMEKEKEDKNE
jgi:predicted CopG family antitoxin